MIGGDFNAHLGEKNRDFKRAHGQHGLGQVNAGEKLLEILQTYGLFAENTGFQKKKEQLITYKSEGKYNTGGLHPCKK